MIKTMNSIMTTNLQLNLKKTIPKQKQTKQTTRTGTESQKWSSRGGLSEEDWERERGGRYRE